MDLSLPSDHQPSGTNTVRPSLADTGNIELWSCSLLKSQTADSEQEDEAKGKQKSWYMNSQKHSLVHAHADWQRAHQLLVLTQQMFSNQSSPKSFTAFWRNFKSQVSRSPSMQRVMRGVGNVNLTGHREHAVIDGGIVRSRQKKRELRGECAFVFLMASSLTDCPRRAKTRRVCRETNRWFGSSEYLPRHGLLF